MSIHLSRSKYLSVKKGGVRVRKVSLPWYRCYRILRQSSRLYSLRAAKLVGVGVRLSLTIIERKEGK